MISWCQSTLDLIPGHEIIITCIAMIIKGTLAFESKEFSNLNIAS